MNISTSKVLPSKAESEKANIKFEKNDLERATPANGVGQSHEEYVKAYKMNKDNYEKRSLEEDMYQFMLYLTIKEV